MHEVGCFPLCDFQLAGIIWSVANSSQWPQCLMQCCKGIMVFISAVITLYREFRSENRLRLQTLESGGLTTATQQLINGAVLCADNPSR